MAKWVSNKIDSLKKKHMMHGFFNVVGALQMSCPATPFIMAFH